MRSCTSKPKILSQQLENYALEVLPFVLREAIKLPSVIPKKRVYFDVAKEVITNAGRKKSI